MRIELAADVFHLVALRIWVTLVFINLAVERSAFGKDAHVPRVEVLDAAKPPVGSATAER